MRFLVTNDDGIEAQGIEVLAKVARTLGDTIVLAPLEGSSGCGHQVTTHKPLRTFTKSEGLIGVEGWPVDCVRLGLKGFHLEVDWVLSGINAGGNLGADIYISGTVAAVREAVLLGHRGIAFSHYKKREMEFDWRRAEQFTMDLVPLLVKRPCPPGSFWNVNLPHLEPGLPDPEIVFCS
ncbi:MAG: 5'/3'-nucleotidase SurE, partial [Gemmataceae bacterium]